MMRKGDKILIAVIAVLVIFGYGIKLYTDYKYKNAESTATVEINGKLYGKYELKKTGNKIMNLELPDGEHSTVEFKDGRVRIQQADCPDKVCVRTGWISKPGEVIVCLPYRIVVKISGERQDVDINVY
jgi:hypothetical protein